jgi:hypothetical protein
LQYQSSPAISVKEPGKLVDGVRTKVVEVPPAPVVFEAIRDREWRGNDDDPFPGAVITFAFSSCTQTL